MIVDGMRCEDRSSWRQSTGYILRQRSIQHCHTEYLSKSISIHSVYLKDMPTSLTLSNFIISKTQSTRDSHHLVVERRAWPDGLTGMTASTP